MRYVNLLILSLCCTVLQGQDALFTTDQTMAMETGATAALMERLHISKKPLSSIDMDALIVSYCEALDPAKIYFTQAEVDGYRQRYANSLDMYIQRGNLTPAFEIFAAFSRHAKERTAFAVAALKDAKLDLNAPGTFPVDRRKLPWPADAAAVDNLWQRRIRLDLLGELFGEDRTSASSDTSAAARSKNRDTVPEVTAERLAEARARLTKRYSKIAGYLKLEAYEVEEVFLNSLTRQYDPHSTFFTKQSLEEFEIQMRNSLCGIGATLQDDEGYCTIKEIMPGGPLALDGRAKTDDRIIAVGQNAKDEPEDIVGMRLNKAISRIRGKQGTEIRLILEPHNGGPRKDIVLKRDQIKLVGQLASARCFEVPFAGGTIPVGVIDLPAFYGLDEKGQGSSPTKDIEELIVKLRVLKMRALIIDLRRNGGGLLNEAIGISGLFIPQGPVVQIRDSAGQSMCYNDEDPKVAWDGPLILLTSKLSASASEIFAGAMRDHRRAIIVGDSTTHGKGSVQNIIELSRLAPQLKSAVKVTIQKWYAPNGSSIQLKGVPADITVPSLFSVMPVAESDLDRPLPWDSVEPMLTKVDEGAWLKAPLSTGLIKRLNDASRRRQIELPEFSTLSHMLSWTSARVNRTEVPLSLNTRRNERIEDLAFRESVRKELEKYGKSELVSKEVKLDAAIVQAKKQTDPNWEKASKSMSRLRGPLEDETWPDYDIQLTEALNIACDWSIELNKTPSAKR